MTRRLPAAERRAQLLATAIDVFAIDGYHATTMDAVALQAGVTKPVLYQHFPSKHHLFLEVLHHVGRRLTERVTRAAASTASPREQVRLGFRAYFDFVADEPNAFRLLFGDGPRTDPEFATTVSEVEGSIATIIAALITTEGLDDAQRLLLAHGIVGLAESTGRHWHNSGREVDLDDLAERVADLAWSGLRAAPTPARQITG
ncbi:MAG: TetR/AcrR family transcriptional regulator [Acidimicrobiales bacterium]